ncbi:MAG: trypsin-like peptidase domain-containing protein [Oligoflexia bacterium]|nr:trypsin-like peptidase domain-containing protein [Oligoflexia bacterium]
MYSLLYKKNCVLFAMIFALIIIMMFSYKSFAMSLKTNVADWVEIDSVNMNESIPILKNIFFIQSQGEYIGTAFIIDPESGEIITNAHVAVLIKQCKTLKIDCNGFVAKNKYHEIKLVAVNRFDRNLDFASIKYQSTDDLSKELIKMDYVPFFMGSKVHTVGFASPEKLVMATGDITGQDVIRKFKPAFYHNCDTIPGMSGSPIFNDKWELVGLHFSGYTDRNPDKNMATPLTLIAETYGLK